MRVPLHRLLPLLLAALLGVGVATTARADATPASATAELERREAEVVRATRARDEARAALDRVASRIASHKAAGETGDALAQELAESQRLASKLTELERALATRRLGRDEAKRARLLALEAHVGALTRAGASEEALSAATAARDEARAELPAAGRALPAAAVADEPEALAARADLLRDERDRLGRRLTELERRISAKEEEESVAREVARLSRDGALFDEAGRSMRVVGRRPTRVVTGLRAPAPEAAAAAPAVGTTVVTAPGRNGYGPRAPESLRDPSHNDALGGAALPGPSPVRAADLRMMPSAPTAPAPTALPLPKEPGSTTLSGTPSERAGVALPRLASDAPLAQLEAERARIAAAMQALETEAGQLEARAKALGR